VNPRFKDSHYLEPMVADGGPDKGYVDKWVVYGKVGNEELFTAKELTVNPGVKVTIKDRGAYGLIAVQGSGWIDKHRLHTPAMIRFIELTEDEVFVTHEAARDGVVFDKQRHRSRSWCCAISGRGRIRRRRALGITKKNEAK